jgi:beta-1,4-mannosyl-glycoprotein beta-1,4-N-acetylglucosaminyltransferase
MKIIDAFPLFDEINLLKIRLNIIKDVVDLFVISVFNISFAGKLMPFNFKSHK